MLRRVALATGGVIALYLLVYASLSTFGTYHRFMESMVGPTMADEWVPFGFVQNGRGNPWIYDFFWPAYVADCLVWHPYKRETGWTWVKSGNGWHMVQT